MPYPSKYVWRILVLKMKRLCQNLVAIIVINSIIFGANSLVFAERPTVSKLLPEETLVYVRIPSVPVYVEKFSKSGMGKMVENPDLSSFIDQLYGEANIAFGPVEEQLGLSLNDLLSLPQGEICAALVAPESGPMALVVFIDVGDQVDSFDTLLANGGSFLQERGAKESTEAEGETNIRYFQGNQEDQRIAVFERDETVCVTTNIDVAHEILLRWDGIDIPGTRPLTENRKFNTIMRRCAMGTGAPEIILYVDPMEIVRTATRGDLTGQIAVATLTGLGVDGFLALGGAVYMDHGEYDSIGQFHILLETPREGIVKMLAIESGETEPQDWVPKNIVNYMTINIDVDTAYSTVDELVAKMHAEGGLEEQLEKISARLGLDVKADLIDQLTGRATLVQWVEPPARINSQTIGFAVEMRDPDSASDTLDDLIAQIPQQIEQKSLSGIGYYELPNGQQRRQRQREAAEKAQAEASGRGAPQNERAAQRQVPEGVRMPTPAVAIIGNHLVFTDSTPFMQELIRAQEGDVERLADDPEYMIVNDEIKMLAGTKEAGGIIYSRPDESLRMFYDLAMDQENRGRLNTMGENNPAMKILGTALDDNPLPPWEELSKYIAPSGGVFINDQTGFHYSAFSFKRE